MRKNGQRYDKVTSTPQHQLLNGGIKTFKTPHMEVIIVVVVEVIIVVVNIQLGWPNDDENLYQVE
jgi:hypothetical protein